MMELYCFIGINVLFLDFKFGEYIDLSPASRSIPIDTE